MKRFNTIAGSMLFACSAYLSACTSPNPPKMAYQEFQLTNDPAGHCINSTQCWSPDDQWIVFDSRNTDAGIISAGTIAAVKVSDKEIKTLYNTRGQTNFGPGVGAVTWSPVANRVLFIHGIRNAGRDRPYGATRRTGVAIDMDRPCQPIWMDARDIDPPFTPGALRGGTHAHTWSGDGQWISFTYNDYLLEQAEKAGHDVKDLRTVGVMAPGKKVIVRNTNHFSKKDSPEKKVSPENKNPLENKNSLDDKTPPENNDSLEDNNGELFAFPIARVTENPAPGTDAIEKAFDECWIGRNGYHKADGAWQHRAIAFQGNLREKDGTRKTEIFVADIPDTVVTTAAAMPAQTDPTRRLPVPPGITQRRISFTEKGVSPVPRHWLRSTPDGALIGFLAADQQDTIQLFGISPNGGAARALTHNAFSITGPFNFSPDGKFVAYAGDNSIWITELAGGHTERVTARFGDEERPDGAVVWSNDGSMLCYNRRIRTGKEGFWQIFVLKRK